MLIDCSGCLFLRAFAVLDPLHLICFGRHWARQVIPIGGSIETEGHYQLSTQDITIFIWLLLSPLRKNCPNLGRQTQQFVSFQNATLLDPNPALSAKKNDCNYSPRFRENEKIDQIIDSIEAILRNTERKSQTDY